MEEELTVDPLFAAMTRPAVFAGIPVSAFIIEFMLVAMVFVAISNPLVFLLMAPLHGILYLLAAHDPATFDNLFLWASTKSRAMPNRGYWNSISFSPLPHKKFKGWF